MNRDCLKPIIVEGKKLIPRLQAAKQIGVSATSLDRYVSLGIIQRENRGRFQFIVESSLTAFKTRIPVPWENAEWISADGKKYYSVSKAASILGAGNSTVWSWAKAGMAPLGFQLDVVKLGVTRPRLFIAEDSLLAFDHLQKTAIAPKMRNSIVKATKAKQATPSPKTQKTSKLLGK